MDNSTNNNTSIVTEDTKDDELYSLSTLNLFLMFLFAVSGGCLVFLFLKCLTKKK